MSAHLPAARARPSGPAEVQPCRRWALPRWLLAPWRTILRLDQRVLGSDARSNSSNTAYVLYGQLVEPEGPHQIACQQNIKPHRALAHRRRIDRRRIADDRSEYSDETHAPIGRHRSRDSRRALPDQGRRSRDHDVYRGPRLE